MDKFCVFILGVLLSGCAGKRHAYYVNVQGSDSADGSREHPWKTPAAVRLKDGDSVFLHGGQVFDGTLRLENLARIYVGAYGNGAATIRSGDSSALVLYRVKGVTVRGLHLEGAGRKAGNVKEGLMLNECTHVLLDDIDITGFQKAGLMIYSSVGVEARRIFAHENGAAGIEVEGQDKKSSRDLRIVDCRADDNPGDPSNLTNHSGNGIVAGHCTGLVIDSCSATNNGWDMPRIGNGPVGIWCYEADSVIIEHCVSYRNKTSPGAADGGGFDLDGGVTNSTIQYCLSYGNQGAGYCIFQYWLASPWHHNVIRYNISFDDGLVSDARGGVYVWNSSGDPKQLYDCEVSHNIIYNTKQAALSYSEKSAHRDLVFFDNVFVGRDSLIRGDRGVDVFRGNIWWVIHGNDRARAEAAEGGKALYCDPMSLLWKGGIF
ncbi:MAG TPA: right-handed parallel beta-helix repeat-containing protein [Puia sp.]|nr:right-handed parallel beta-helix repeat-containing protein [Puia sp.]